MSRYILCSLSSTTINPIFQDPHTNFSQNSFEGIDVLSCNYSVGLVAEKYRILVIVRHIHITDFFVTVMARNSNIRLFRGRFKKR